MDGYSAGYEAGVAHIQEVNQAYDAGAANKQEAVADSYERGLAATQGIANVASYNHGFEAGQNSTAPCAKLEGKQEQWELDAPMLDQAKPYIAQAALAAASEVPVTPDTASLAYQAGLALGHQVQGFTSAGDIANYLDASATLRDAVTERADTLMVPQPVHCVGCPEAATPCSGCAGQ